MRRYALIILVLTILILNSIMQHAAQATPLQDTSLWELRFALPAGVAAAALCIALAGLGAQFWRNVLPLCGAKWAPMSYWNRLATSGLWCGWLPLLCAQTYTEGDTLLPLGAPSHWLVGAFFALVLCRMLGNLAAKWQGAHLLHALVAAAAAVLLGHELCRAVPLCPLVLGLAAAPALRLITTRQLPPPQMLWLLVAGFTFCAYVAAFGYLLAWYAPTEARLDTPWGLWLGGGFLAMALLLIALAPLRRSMLGGRIIAFLGLVIGAVWLWLEFDPAQKVLPAQQPAGIATYVVALVLFSIPTALLIAEKTRSKDTPRPPHTHATE